MSARAWWVIGASLLAAQGSCRWHGLSGQEAGTFSVAMWEPESIDPTVAAEEAGTTIARAMFEGLLRPAAGNGPPRPGMATKWERSSDGLTYLFYLRPNALWSDGTRVTAHDFVYAFQRALDPEVGSRNANLFFHIKNARAVLAGATGQSHLGVKALSDLLLQIRLEKPAPFLRYLLTYPAFAPVPRWAVERYGKRWTRPNNIVVNGPFALQRFIPGVGAELVRNPRYWDAAHVRLKRVVFRFLENNMLVYFWFLAGRVHWLKGTLGRDGIVLARRQVPEELHEDPVLCTYYLVFNMRRPPFDDVRLRRALSLAVDRRLLVGTVLLGGQPPARSLVPPAMKRVTGYEPFRGRGFDPGLAVELLSRYARDRGRLPKVTYIYNTGEGHRLIAEFLQEQWRRHLGMYVELRAMEWKTLLSMVRNGEFELARASWCADFPDASNFLDVFATGAPSNYSGYHNPSYDGLLAAASNIADTTARNRMLGQAEAMLLRDAPIVPLYHYTRVYLLSRRVHGFEPNLLDVHPFDLLSFYP